MVIDLKLIMLVISLVTIVIMTVALNKKEKKLSVYKYFTWLNITLIIHILALVLQMLLGNSLVPSIYFEYMTYIGSAFTPICLLFVALSYVKKEKYIHNLKGIYILPILFLVLVFTNGLHGLFYSSYNLNSEMLTYGPMYYLFTVYSCVCFLISIVVMIRGAIKRSGLFSTSTLLLIFGIIALIAGNVISIIQTSLNTAYLMPILFVAFSLLASISIFKYNSLKITPIALKTIMDTMTDAFIVISNDGSIVDYNELFYKEFLLKIKRKDEDDNLVDMLSASPNIEFKKLSVKILETIVSGEGNIFNLKLVNEDIELEKYYEIDINPIKSKNKRHDIIGVLLLVKNVTEHIKDLNELKAKQEIIVKQGQLVSIGEVAGGVAHDINTPISAIKTGIVMLKEMNENLPEEQLEILGRMDNCADKIINIVNSMRNQIRNLGGNVNVKFKISSVLEDVKCLTLHEVNKHKAKLEITVEDDLAVEGDPAKLSQVLTNMVVNAAQAYEGKEGGKINLCIMKAPKKQALIKIVDFGGGLDESVKPYIFKSILTTKGIAGTGLGLYLAYSVIKGNFNGDITFNSESGIGTTFCITIPIAKPDKKKKTSEDK